MKKIVLKPKKNVEKLMTILLEANMLYGAEFLKWVMGNMKWLMKEYKKRHNS